MISQTATAIDLYSDFAEDLETICCFFDFHEIKDSPRNMQKQVIDLLMLGHEAQSASAKAFKCSSDLLEKNNPWPGELFRYCKTL